MTLNLMDWESRSVIDLGFARSGDVCLAKALETNKGVIRCDPRKRVMARSSRVGEIRATGFNEVWGRPALERSPWLTRLRTLLPPHGQAIRPSSP